ncbi:uncharacterized protein MONBRDRAFT_33242 [Monosiga brevicollis MX1]|uniref:protein-tyrosine-phosphatase n=1 Tax=Monosiga brevicollis TaxID=81824 RepID=A9V4C1_MONBE|nr:uncharacterized protein MONBRDRAFT_33242 [Monosiga brevicollis MX1]EDQ87684.1 predicted protein [Monosiga brevicollis MX1]|eukprot:XP_001747604.1 hypothetical protein [Monosiga brevicollis MX1]
MARNHISKISHKNMRFLITDRPSDATVEDYVRVLQQENVVALCRVCEPSYDVSKLKDNGIEVHDWAFQDGAPPPDEVIDNWLRLCRETFAQHPNGFVAVHCVAGLGRAPVLVALSLIEAGMSSEDAVLFIREKRHGAINRRQLQFLQDYKRRGKAKGCIIM